MIEDWRELDAVLREAVHFGFTPIPLEQLEGPKKAYWNWHRNAIVKAIRAMETPANVAIATGAYSNVIVFVLRKYNHEVEYFDELCKKNGIEGGFLSLNTPIVTIADGIEYYVYFRYDQEKHRNINEIRNFSTNSPDLQVMCNQRWVVYPGSVHPGCKLWKHTCGSDIPDMRIIKLCYLRGKKYEWYKDKSPAEHDPMPVPEWLNNMVLEKAKSPHHIEFESSKDYPPYPGYYEGDMTKVANIPLTD